MSKPVRRTIGWWVGTCLSAILAAVGTVALRHALETPQPLKSPLPGEAFLYRWQRRSIFYKVLGSAESPPLVLLHRPDIGASAREMQYLMSPLAQTYRVYAPDLLGFGLSDRPNRQYSAALYSSLCQDFLRDVVKAPATLVASELSCNYAVSVAAGAPDLCTALVLISPHAHQGNARPGFPGAEVPLLKALLYPLLSTRLGFLLTHGRRRGERTDFAEFYAQTHQLGAEHAVMALLAGKLVEDVSRQLQSLQQPVLLIWGAQALEDQKTIAGLHTTAVLADPERRTREVELIPDAGLAVQEEQPERVVAAIRRWQAEITPVPERVEATSIITHFPESEEQSIAERATEQALPEATQAQRDAEPAARMPFSEEEVRSGIDPTSLTGEKEDGPFVDALAKAEPIMAYCVKCRQKREMLDAHEVIMKNGRRAVRGTCAVCGTPLNRIGRLA
jgi:pimeloyl-ACP methyl ester carboxylesterase